MAPTVLKAPQARKVRPERKATRVTQVLPVRRALKVNRVWTAPMAHRDCKVRLVQLDLRAPPVRKVIPVTPALLALKVRQV